MKIYLGHIKKTKYQCSTAAPMVTEKVDKKKKKGREAL